jgi:conserved hypothetical protein
VIVADARDEAAVRALGDSFAKAFVQKNAEVRASLFAEDGTFVTPQGNFLQGHVAMVKDFGPEAEQAVNGTTQAAFSNYRIRFIKPDVAVADALLTVRNVNGPDGAIIPAIPINFFFVAVRHSDKWLIEDGRAHFAPAPPNGMTTRNSVEKTCATCHAVPQGAHRYKHAGVSIRRACSSQAPPAGAVQPLAERANPSGPHPEWRVIYWASPVYQHKPDPLTGNSDPLADVGIWICAHVPGCTNTAVRLTGSTTT